MTTPSKPAEKNDETKDIAGKNRGSGVSRLQGAADGMEGKGEVGLGRESGRMRIRILSSVQSFLEYY